MSAGFELYQLLGLDVRVHSYHVLIGFTMTKIFTKIGFAVETLYRNCGFGWFQ